MAACHCCSPVGSRNASPPPSHQSQAITENPLSGGHKNQGPRCKNWTPDMYKSSAGEMLALWNVAEGECEDSAASHGLRKGLQSALDVCLFRSYPSAYRNNKLIGLFHKRVSPWAHCLLLSPGGGSCLRTLLHWLESITLSLAGHSASQYRGVSEQQLQISIQ